MSYASQECQRRLGRMIYAAALHPARTVSKPLSNMPLPSDVPLKPAGAPWNMDKLY